ncbi:Cu-Zn family superoxide dismutase [Sphaerotilus hippei]|uniref:Superoxide dismutase [Cu-Zn] n=1 Tax=Sphaerotilus hippei TaxID=744406 RepID=A0A318H4C8_9BURK|nr:superoxide dismutase family protein [Sphaerotilus hippei]PXW98001.1 Cu-Zn family superoxide dismutase [Sphaerotilus hippei]
MRLSFLMLTAGLLTLSGCGAFGPRGEHGAGPGPGHMMSMAHARLAPTQGQSAAGEVMFHQHGDHVMVHARLTGLKPGAEHGFHVHEKGDCSAPDGSSAGGHHNPAAKAHGPQDADHHAGDLPNLKADPNGVVDQKFMVHGVALSGADSLVGRGLIVHAGPDDYRTQPTGNSGARIACGVITSH